MTLLTYEIFNAIVEEKSFLRAAQLLNMTPSAVSHAVSSMEKELGFTLFIRNRNGVQLTSNGESLYPRVREVLNTNEYLLQSVAKLNGLELGNIKVGCFNSICTAWMPSIMRDFRENFPQITFEIYQGTYSDVMEWLKNGTIDLGFLSKSCAKDFHYTSIYRDRLMCVVPKGFQTKHNDYITLEELQDQPFVIQRESCDADVKNFLDKYNLAIHSSHHVIDDQSTIALIEAGMGIGIMPNILMKQMNSHVDVYPIKPAEYRTICLATTHPHKISPAVAQFISFVSQMDFSHF